jgi:hypothetical protein
MKSPNMAPIKPYNAPDAPTPVHHGDISEIIQNRKKMMRASFAYQ